MYTEIDRLIDLLEIEGIPCEVTDDACGNSMNQVWYPSREESICDAISHEYSYGGREGLIEIMGLTENNDDVEGWLYAEQVYYRIRRHYYSNKK